MTVFTNIFQSYLAPMSVFKKRIIYASDSELFGILIIGCLITLIGRFPDMYAQALFYGDPLVGLFSATLVAILLILPLGLYFFSGLFFLVFRVLRIEVSNFQLRLSLFWSFTLVSPFGLLLAMMELINVLTVIEVASASLIFIIFLVYFCLFLRVCFVQNMLEDKKP